MTDSSNATVISSDWSQYVTPEPPELLWYEQVNYIAINVGLIGYGFLIVSTVACAYYLFIERNIRKNWKWFIFIFIMFGCGTVSISMNMRFAQMAWIDYRGYPGGPIMFLLNEGNAPILVGGNSISVIFSFFADGLLIYRVFALYRKWWLLVLPSIAWVAMQVLGGFFVAQTAQPGSSVFADGTLNFSIPYFALSMSLNILLTGLLVGRLMYMRSKISNALGSRYGDTYTHVASMILESAAPFGLVSFVFLVLYILKNTAAGLLIPLLVDVQCMSAILIVMRVAQGRAWSSETISESNLTQMKYPGNGSAIKLSGTTANSGYNSNKTFNMPSVIELRSTGGMKEEHKEDIV